MNSFSNKAILILLYLNLNFILFGQSNIIIIGAHPDDCELNAGGLAIQLIEKGHNVKLVSLTNGNKGHHKYDSKTLGSIRSNEINEVKKRMGCEYELFDNNDGELINSIELRNDIIKVIRDWKADVVITHPDYDYHPDHRNTAIAVQDAAFLVTVPLSNPESPYLKQNPVFLYMLGRLDNPYRSEVDIVVDITAEIEKKAYVLDSHYSQFYEWLPWINNEPLENVDVRDILSRVSYMNAYILRRNAVNETVFPILQSFYGSDYNLDGVKAVEKFEICPFGRKVDINDIKVLLPVFTN